MSSVHAEVLALLRQWRTELDETSSTAPIDLPTLQTRQRYEELRFPSVAQAVEQVRATVLRGSAFPSIDEVVSAAAAETQPTAPPELPHLPAWIPDELYPYPAAG